MREWVEPEQIEIPPALREALDVHPLVLATLVRRGIAEPEVALRFLYSERYTPASPYELPGMERAISRLEKALAAGERICVWGDFDVDGQTATTLLVTALRQFGGDVRYYIPQRLTEGHGIQGDRLIQILDEGVQLVMTCDTGIAAHEAIAYAQARGVDVIVTDHHQLPSELPKAYVCVNPQMLPPSHPLHTLPGVGCAYKVIEALCARYGQAEYVQSLLDLVALGIVADVAILRGDTRYLLQQGLVVLRNTPRLGLQMLMEIANIEPQRVDEGQIGFGIAPRLNALGRLGDANQAVEFLSTADREQAKVLAYRVKGLNNERKLQERQIFEAAQRQIDSDPTLLDYSVLVLGHPEWSAGVLGIVANRLVEEYARPVVLFVTPPNDVARGSARSVVGCDITAAISDVASRSQIITQYGGHMMAAGVSIVPEAMGDFRRLLSVRVREMLKTPPEMPQLQIDGVVNLADLNMELVQALGRLAPFGAGNPPMVLVCQAVRLVSQRNMGRTQEHLRLRIADGADHEREFVWWQADADRLPSGVFDVAFTIRESFYKGRHELLIEYVDHRQVETAPRELSPSTIEIVDYRGRADALMLLRELLSTLLPTDVMVWHESGGGQKLDGIAVYKRHELKPRKQLIVWSVPLSTQVWRDILIRTMPQKVYVFAVPQTAVRLDELVTTFGGVIKYALKHYDGRIEIEQAAAALNVTAQVVEKLLVWFADSDVIRIVRKTQPTIWVEQGKHKELIASDSGKGYKQSLEHLLDEIVAYRIYFAKARPEKLLISAGLKEK